MARDEQADVDRIRKKNSTLFVVADRVELREAPVVHLGSLEALVEIAKRYETVIVELRDDLGADFLLWDDGLTFRFRHGPAVEPPAKPVRRRRSAPDGQVVIDTLRGGAAPA